MDVYPVTQPTDSKNQSIQALTPVSTQQVVPGNSSTVFDGYESVVGLKPSLVRCVAIGGNGHIKIGVNPSAKVTDTTLPENSVEYFYVPPGQKISVFGECDYVEITLMN